MKRVPAALFCIFVLAFCVACGNSSARSQQVPVTVQVTNQFTTIEASGASVTLSAQVSGDSGNHGVTWTLSNAGTVCSPGCGTLKPAAPPSLTAVYTPPNAVPLDQEATITVRSVANDQQIFAFNFQILAAIAVNIASKFTTVNVGGPVQNLSATVQNDIGNAGLTWTLTASGTNCSPDCGVLTVAAAPSLTAQYQPPATPPSAADAAATITATSVADTAKKDSFNFSIVTPAISVTITNKFQSVNTGGQAVTVNATIANDFSNKGLTWSLAAGNAPCSPGCGTLTPAPAGSPSTAATYSPPSVPPSAANATPTIIATAVADTTKMDSFTFNIVTPAIAVSIQNPFKSTFTGNQPITVNASISNDFLNQGLAWTLLNAGAACTDAATCGTLTAIGNPSTSATYTPPPTPNSGSTLSLTIMATSVSDNTKSDNFTFALVVPNSLITGSYVFLLRGYDQLLQPMALAGVVVADGMGNITGGEYDLNDDVGGSPTVTTVVSLTGSYSVNTSFANIPRVSFNIIGGGTTRLLTCAFSSDGMRATAIEVDPSLVLNAGSVTRQDPAAANGLATSGTATSFAFGLDSDAPINGRVVEAGQFIAGPGATSVSGGVADEGQANAASPIFGGIAGAAAIDTAASSMKPPDILGRGTLTLSVASNPTQYAYYVVNSSQLDLIEIDTGGPLKTIQAGTARNQAALTAASINATSVVALTGMTSVGTPPAPSPDVMIGVLTISAGASPVGTFDSNSAGTVVTANTTSGVFEAAFDQHTGRCVIRGPFIPDAAIYLYDTGTGYVADVTPSGDGVNHGFSGPMMLQTIAPGNFSLASLFGNSIGLAGASSSSSMTNLDLAFDTDGAGNYMALFDFTVSNLTVGSNGQGQGVALNGATYQVEDANLGRGELLQIPSGFFNNFPVQSDKMAFYIVGPRSFVAMEDAGLSPSSVMFFYPQ